MPKSEVYSVLADLESRLISAHTELQRLISERPVGVNRLLGKANGISLALSYLREVDDDYIQRVS